MISRILPIVIAASLGVAATAAATPTDGASSIDDINTLLADNPRKDRRDDRQEGRQDGRDDRRDCRQEEGRVGHDKRDCKQDSRDEGGDEGKDDAEAEDA